MLIIHLPPTANGSFDFVVSADGLNQSGSGQASAAQLPRSGEVVAVVPWQVLSWHTVHLPPGVGQRSPAVLQSLLEEQLLQDPSDMHLVLSPLSAKALRLGGPVQAVACAKSWLRQSLAPLQAAGVRVQRLLPELAPSNNTPALHLLSDNGHTQALLCQADTVWRLPPQALAAARVAQWADAPVWSEPAVVEQAAGWSEQPPRIQTAAQRWLQAAASDWNLAQGEWAQNSRLRGQRWLQESWRILWHAPEWQMARRGLLALLLVQLVGLNAWAWREQAALQQQQAHLNALVNDSFPNVTVVVDAPLQMQRELQALQQGAGLPLAADLDAMLQTLSAHWPDNTPPAKLDYRLGELRLTDLPATTLSGLAAVPWRELGYQWRMDGNQAVLRAEVQP